MRILALCFSLVALTTAGCGGKGAGIPQASEPLAPSVSQPKAQPGARPTKAVVKLAAVGTLPAQRKIGGLSAMLRYPGDKGLSITPEGVTLSGAGVGTTMVPNTTLPGRVALALVTVNGIPAGEFATLSFDIANGYLPAAEEFSIAVGTNAIDTTAQSLNGIQVSVASVTLQ